jgi:hypothetical protein
MKLNRQIGYLKAAENDETSLLDQQNLDEVKIDELQNLIKLKSKKITSWINSHPAIKWSLICKDVGIDKGNFHKILKSAIPLIKIENILKLEKELKKYGYQ